MAQPAAPELNVSDAHRAALGTLRSFHPGGSGILKVNITIAAVFTLLLLGPAVWFLIAGLKGPGSGMMIGALIFGALGIGPAIGVIYLVRKLAWRLYLFDNGFVFARKANRVVLWDDVESLMEQQDVVSGIKADRRVRFQLKDGRQLGIDSAYKDFAAFAGAVREAVTRAVPRRAGQELAAGRSFAFGKLLLSQKGLEKPGEALSWAEVHSIGMEPRVDGQVHANAVIIYKRGVQGGGIDEKVEWYVRQVPRFGNVDAFLHLAGRFTRVGNPAAGR